MTKYQSPPLAKFIPLVTYLLLVCLVTHAQYVPQVIPPSPTASGLQSFGNTDVSLYTGAARTAIPIHTIKLRELQFPIVLNYSGSGGINVQEVASWVGIGWTLNATGAISRTIYGLADDRYNSGYMHVPAIPPLTDEDDDENLATYIDYAGGLADAEPDKFFYNANGVSGSFYITKQKEVVQVPLTNHKIIPEFDVLDKIIAFDLITDKGLVYRFSELEESRSYGLTGYSTDNNYYVSSWYLTSVRNYNRTETITFHYEAYDFNQTAEFYISSFLDNPGGNFLPRYSVTETHAKRLKFITYNQADTVKFIPGDLARRDLFGEKFLAAIEIREQEMNRSVEFSYSYFDNNGMVPITSTSSCSGTYAEISYINESTDGDNCKRLKLDTVRFFNNDKTESLPYAFEYYTQAYLPHRFSYARDHWGFYNGQNSNPGLEPRRKIDRRPIQDALQGGIDFDLQGNANREPSPVHAKAGVLTKIIYPTGGSTIYEYELHQSSVIALPNDKQALTVDLTANSLIDTIHLETINDPFIEFRVTVMGISLSDNCDFTVLFRNIHQPGLSKSLSGFNEGESGLGGLYRTIFLEAGDYEISFTAHDGDGNCFEDFYRLRFTWENELPTLNKNVGGLRIKKATDISDLGDSVTRVYTYTLQNSALSSGALTSIPRYGYYLSGYRRGYSQDLILAFIRMYNTNTPLALTQGSHVGYKRVEVTTASPQETGKSVFYYTSPAEFPDFTRGWEASKYDDEINLGNGHSESTYMFPHHDSRDWKRGLLYAQVDFAFQNDQFVRIASTESHYKIYAEVNTDFDQDWKDKYPIQFQSIEPEYNKDEFISNDWIDGEGLPKLLGVRTQPSYANDTGTLSLAAVKKYEYYTGRIELVSQTERTFNDGQTFLTGTSYFYQNSDYFYPTKIQTATSLSDSLTRLMKYPFDRASISGLATDHAKALDTLVLRNVIAGAVETITKHGDTERERQRTNYKIDDDQVQVENIATAHAGTALESEVEFTAYDADGNLLEYTARNGFPTSFLYGYENKLPIMQAVNAHYNQIFYESFEESGTTGDAKAGKRYYEGDYTFNLSTAQANSILSYWYWDVNIWKFKQVSYSPGSYTITDGTRIDEVRVYPAGAQITTYTYSPGIGITSVSDPNNKMMFYSYDKFGRLTLIQDHLGNIVQRTQYHYKGQE